MIKYYILSLTILIVTFFACCSNQNEKSAKVESQISGPLDAVVPNSRDLSLIGLDSLKKLLPISSNVEKIKIYDHLSLAYVWSWPDSAIVYSSEGLKLAEKLKSDNQQIIFLSRLTATYSETGNFSIALEKGFKALEIAKVLNDPYQIAFCFADIGAVYFYAEDYLNAISYFLKTKNNSSVFNASKRLYSAFLGETYFHLNNLDSAQFYIHQAYELDVKAADHWSVPYLYMGKLAEKRELYSEALQFYKASIAWEVPEADYIKAYLAIANIFNKTNRLDSGIYYAKLAYSVSQNTSLYIYSFGAVSLLKEIYRTNHQTDSAFKYQEIMLFEKDRLFSREKLAQLQNLAFDEQQRLDKIKQEREKSRNQIIFYSLAVALALFGVIVFFLVRNNKFKQRAYRLLEKQKGDIDMQKSKVETTLFTLKSTQSQLIHSEKMASLGELTAGIAHEIQNPLNFVNNFSEVSKELMGEMNEELDKGDIKEAKEVGQDIEKNLDKINHHGQRASSIVKGMLEHSRSDGGVKELTDINALADEYLRLAYHGLRAKDKSFNANFKTELDESIPKINVIPQDIGRVLLNLINNAFYAVSAKASRPSPEVSAVEGVTEISDYSPQVSISTRRVGGNAGQSIEIRIKDNGDGIPENIKEKIFQPFFTTKPTGSGTGLGLSLSYDIIKAHGGDILVESSEQNGTEFIINIPNQQIT